MKESELKNYLLKQAKAHDILARKVVWEGRDGAPDWVLMAKPVNPYQPGRILWAELKAPGEEAKGHQLREHKRLRQYGQAAEVLDSFERIDVAILWLTV